MSVLPNHPLTTGACAKLSKISYLENPTANSIQNSIGFECDDEFITDSDEVSGYFAFCVRIHNAQSNRYDAYVVHRGTANKENVKADIDILLGKIPRAIVRRSFAFTDRVVRGLGEQVDRVVHIGHSLGGYLAVLNAARTQYWQGRNSGISVAHDNPGAMQALLTLQGENAPHFEINSLGLAAYSCLTEPNLVNTHGGHVGVLYQSSAYGSASQYAGMQGQLTFDQARIYLNGFITSNSHSVENLVSNLENNLFTLHTLTPQAWPQASNQLIMSKSKPRLEDLFKVPAKMADMMYRVLSNLWGQLMQGVEQDKPVL
jgi:hypothetical protein